MTPDVRRALRWIGLAIAILYLASIIGFVLLAITDDNREDDAENACKMARFNRALIADTIEAVNEEDFAAALPELHATLDRLEHRAEIAARRPCG